MNNKYYTTFPSLFNNFTIVWIETNSELKIQRIFLSDSNKKAETKAYNVFSRLTTGKSKIINELGEKIKRFLAGEEITFDLNLIDFSQCYPIQEQVLLAEYQIPRGYVSTYKRIAKHIGITNGARVVGNALANNPFPIIIPCHRAIKSDGSLGGFQGGLAMKEALLKLEGITFSDNGKVKTENIYY
ncbi:MAG: methylated-DNA--[protein]-cysteine S-methyltransferase [Asgard group archaeon]|nr:methylated-DNA--[protein]-cysteine S-methyltransferase [Asgard group archaeon]